MANTLWVSWLWDAVKLLFIAFLLWCVWMQWRAMHRIAFGRSMFISWTAVLMGFLVGLLPTVSAAVVSILLLITGFGMMAVLGVKSWQRLRRARGRTSSAPTRHSS
ncbi:hypothetical protein [Alicyclobacillus macrosporangiidus]|uniref:hypothetical protein n=1 Tax=Alicyclobacillus macrosporangiidus TaxID=392015 RepID=UPI0004968A11|nr:hypothetical protein [Alicyclobacillus macrosporangiidus]